MKAGNGWPNSKGIYSTDNHVINFIQAVPNHLSQHELLKNGRRWNDAAFSTRQGILKLVEPGNAQVLLGVSAPCTFQNIPIMICDQGALVLSPTQPESCPLRWWPTPVRSVSCPVLKRKLGQSPGSEGGKKIKR